MQIKQQMLTLCMPLVRLYWRVFKPKTHGVRVLIVSASDADTRVLLVRHAYGDQSLWNIPGGGFNPKKESAAEAARREVTEELSLDCVDLREIGMYQTEGEGKRDTVVLFSALLPRGGAPKPDRKSVV